MASNEMDLETEKYVEQNLRWPKVGRHILAQYDDKSIVVYQAYKPDIAEYAVKHQRFGGPAFSFGRMSWIKTNFLWMMYRCGWASKKNQERVLAVRITRDGFQEILKNAYTAAVQKKAGLATDDIMVRLQWDPDHSPTYEKQDRKAIQLGLKGEILKKYGTEWIVSIQDITDFVVQQRQRITEKFLPQLLTAKETVYPITDPILAQQLEMDVTDL